MRRTVGNTYRFIMRMVNTLLCPIHYSHAVKKLSALEARCFAQKGDLFDVPFQYRGFGFYNKISPTQVVAEIRELYNIVRGVNPKYVCEIGTDKGGTFYLLCKASADDGVVVSVDLPSRPHYSPERRRLYSHFRKTSKQTLHFIASDSHRHETLDALKAYIGDNQLDFLFIDGDHTYEGVRQDYEMYSPLVRPDGLIVFHDIRTVREGCGVQQFWEELKQNIPNYREITTQPPGPLGAGIGLIYRDR